MLKKTLLLVAVLFGSFYYLAEKNRQIIEAEVFEHTQHLAIIAHNYQVRLIENTAKILATMAKELEDKTIDKTICDEFLNNYQRNSIKDRYLNVGIIDPKGNLVCSLIPTETDFNLSHRLYFQQAINTQKFAVGEYQIGMLSGKPSLNFGQPIIDANQEVQGVIFLSMGLQWFDDFFEPLHLEDGWTMKVMDHNSIILANLGQTDTKIGSQGLTSQVLSAILAGQEQPLVMRDEQGQWRAYSFAPAQAQTELPKSFIVISRPLQTIYNNVTWLLVFTYGLAIVFALLLKRFIFPPKPQKAQRKT